MNNTLHIVTKPPSESESSWFTALSQGDGIIFIEGGAFWISHITKQLPKLQNKIKLYALNDDMEARGLTNEINDLSVISYTEFVELTTAFQRTATW